MKGDIMEEILRSAAAEVRDEAEPTEECVLSADLDRRMEALLRKRKGRTLRTAVASAIAAAAVIAVTVGVVRMFPRNYRIGDVAQPTWFPDEVTMTVVTDTAEKFVAEYVTEDGRKFSLTQEKLYSAGMPVMTTFTYTTSTATGSAPLGPESDKPSDYASGWYAAPDGLVSGSTGDDSGAVAWVMWEDSSCRYSITGEARELEIRRMARSAGAE